MATKKKTTKQAKTAKKRAPVAKKKASRIVKSLLKKRGAAAARPKKAAAGKARVRGAKASAKAVGRKASARKAPARKAPVRKALTRAPKPAAPKAEFVRRDGAGHLDPKYAAELRATRGRPEVDPAGFLDRSRSSDDLVEGLGEEFVETATSAEYEAEDALNKETPEETGGPFVETTGAEEFGHGIDASNPKGAKREPFPTT